MADELVEIERDRYPFVIMEKAIFDDHRELMVDGTIKKIGKRELVTYAAVCYFADSKTGTAFPSFKKISAVARLGRSTVHEALKVLVAFGYIHMKNRYRRSEKTGESYQSTNLYTILSQYEVIHRGSPATGRGVVRTADQGSPATGHYEQELLNKNQGNKKNPNQVVDNFFSELESTFKLYSDFKLGLSDFEKKNLTMLVEKYGSKKVLEIWSSYQHDKPGKPVRFFLEDFGVYKKAHDDENSFLPVVLKRTPDECPICGKPNIKKGMEAFMCTDCKSFWELIDGEWVQTEEAV